MNILLKKLEHLNSVYCHGGPYGFILKHLWEAGKIELISAKYYPGGTTVYLSKNRTWRTGINGFGVTLRLTEGVLSASVTLHKCDRRSGLMLHKKWTAEFVNIPIETIEEFYIPINKAFKESIEKEYNDRADQEKEQRLAEIEHNILTEGVNA